ncbi:hypothetical protein Dimus_025834 [Dionaea muscipula]
MLHSLHPPQPSHSLLPSSSLYPITPFSAPNSQLRIPRGCRRRKSKPKRKLLAVRNHFDNVSIDLLSHLLPPFAALGLASAVALSLPKLYPFRTKRDRKLKPQDADLGEWILFTSPTPFNRFVVLRCPSISLVGSEFLEDVNEKLIKEDRHYVRVDSGRIQVRDHEEDDDQGGGGKRSRVEYQRVCVGTEGGGVISLDWPANLDLEEEHGLDTTVLIVPGTPEGSMDENVRCFVCECLKRGLFPVVMNPRGCAGSPLTTPRLFTAADSHDVLTSVEFLNRSRPCSTLMAVGYGFGANMLTKYLAEAGESTPLAAATCIDNPFDLEEAARTASYDSAINEKLTREMINILKSNKVVTFLCYLTALWCIHSLIELFQGRKRGFDVEKALSAESFLDFEKSISMVSYGFSTVEEFYSKSSTRTLVGKLKIPVLFIQSDDGTVPIFSVPRGSIAENPFTSLLMCSLPSYRNANSQLVMSWCQLLTVEWLTAVELGFLKGRHPLVEDVDVTVKPPIAATLIEDRASATNEKFKSVLNLTQKEISEERDSSDNLLGHGDGSHNYWELNHKDSAEVKVLAQYTNSVDAPYAKEADPVPVVSDQGQVLHTAEVVMNVLDVTMPGTLKEEERKKVLTAVGQGETLLKALQDAVPEDVRGKLTNSVSEILRAQGKNMNIGLSSIGKIANLSSGLKLKIEGKMGNKPRTEGGSDDNYHSDQKSLNYAGDGPVYNEPGVTKLAGESVPAVHHQENSLQSFGLGDSQFAGSHADDISRKVLYESHSDLNRLDSVGEKVVQLSGSVENDFETNSRTNSSLDAKPDDRYLDDEAGQLKEETTVTAKDGNNKILYEDPSKTNILAVMDGTPPQMGSVDALLSNEPEDKGNKDENAMQPVPDQNNPNSVSNAPSFSVTQAFDALTGFDDSTQLAVNSVFGVIENMIMQLEEGKEGNTSGKGHAMESDTSRSDFTIQVTSDELQSEKSVAGNASEEVRPSLNSISDGAICTEDSLGSNTESADEKQDQRIVDLTGYNLMWEHAVFHRNPVNLPPHGPTNSNGDALYREWLRRYMLSKMQGVKSLDLDATTALSLDYIPEEGQWKVREQQGNNVDLTYHNAAYKAWCRKEIDLTYHNAAYKAWSRKEIEPSYAVFNSERLQEPVGDFDLTENLDGENGNALDKLKLIKSRILDSLLVLVNRKLSPEAMSVMEPVLMKDMEDVANTVSLAVTSDIDLTGKHIISADAHSLKLSSRLLGEHLTEAVSLAVTRTSYLRRVLPVGLILGSCVASLRELLSDAVFGKSSLTEALNLDENYVSQMTPKDQLVEVLAADVSSDRGVQGSISGKPSSTHSGYMEANVTNMHGEEKVGSSIHNGETILVSAVTAAVGASAFFERQDGDKGDNALETSSKPVSTKGYLKKDTVKLGEADKQPQKIITSLAEKAMLVGKVDQDRLVAMLAGLGQRGGILKLVGKIALLWGGFRGAMSLTDRLISFLHIDKRPLQQRILGFVCMVLVLWSPVVVPLLPTIVQNWATHDPYKIAQFASITGLYVAITILVIIWGKRIRGHENPLQQYGLNMASSTKVLDFLTGLVGGLMLVLTIHSVNAFLGFAKFSLPAHLCSTFDVAAKLKAYVRLFTLAVQVIVTATCIASVEELVFRSWLPEEIAIDFGFHPGIILAGLAFALSQRSLQAIPGLWLLSLTLSGIRHMKKGSLYIPIGLRAGIIASSFALQTGGFLIYQPKLPLWAAGTHPFQPFSGVVGLLISLFSAIAFYPRQHSLGKKISRKLCE